MPEINHRYLQGAKCVASLRSFIMAFPIFQRFWLAASCYYDTYVRTAVTLVHPAGDGTWRRGCSTSRRPLPDRVECPRSLSPKKIPGVRAGAACNMDSAGSGNLTDGCGSDGSSGEGGLGEVLAGVAIAVVASVGINIGNNVQVLPGLRCIRSQGGLGWPGIGVRVRVRGGLRLQGFASTAAQPAPPEGSASGQSLDPRP